MIKKFVDFILHLSHPINFYVSLPRESPGQYCAIDAHCAIPCPVRAHAAREDGARVPIRLTGIPGCAVGHMSVIWFRWPVSASRS